MNREICAAIVGAGMVVGRAIVLAPLVPVAHRAGVQLAQLLVVMWQSFILLATAVARLGHVLGGGGRGRGLDHFQGAVVALVAVGGAAGLGDGLDLQGTVQSAPHFVQGELLRLHGRGGATVDNLGGCLLNGRGHVVGAQAFGLSFPLQFDQSPERIQPTALKQDELIRLPRLLT